jgi:FkbM family methyltransferase
VTESTPASPHHNRWITFGVFCLVCTIFYYVQKDVRQQIREIETSYATQKEAPVPNQSTEPSIECPRSKFEGAGYFSQYYEDYILDFVFSDVSKGVYIDIGAAEPMNMSVTHKFYTQGWRGINIDPMPSYVDMYQKERPDDLFLNVGISNEESSLTFYDCGNGCGFSTFDKKGFETISNSIGLIFMERKVPVITMKKVLSTYPQEHIDFVNIDVEGWEKQVLESFDFSLAKPEVFILESTVPNTEIPNYHNWENILLDQGYVLAMTDFLNRYYINSRSNSLIKYLRRFSYIDMCVRQSKIGNDVYPTSVGKLMRKKNPK